MLRVKNDKPGINPRVMGIMVNWKLRDIKLNDVMPY